MRFPSRVNGAHGTLAFLELAVVPVSVLATFLVVLLAGGVADVARWIGALLALGESTVDVLVGVVVLLTAVVLLATGALAVVGYQQFFDRSFRDISPLPLIVVPAIGVVVPIAYALVVLETRTLPWWLFTIVVLSAHAVALRLIAIYAMLDRRRRTGAVVGVGAGATAVVAQLHVVTTRFLDGMGDGIAHRLLAIVTDSWIPGERWLLVVVPLSVAALYGGWRRLSADGGWDLPDRAGGRSVDATVDRLRDRSAGEAIVGGIEHLLRIVARLGRNALGHLHRFAGRLVRDAFGRLRDRYAASTDSGGRSVPSPPPSSARSSSRPPASGASSSRPPSSPSSGGSRNRRASGSGSAKKSAFKGGGDSSDEASDGSTDDDPGSSSTEDASSAAGGGADDGATNGGTGSDTRIFVDGFDGYGSDGNAVETCPACEDDIPTDGVYKFCPFCGHEL